MRANLVSGVCRAAVLSVTSFALLVLPANAQAQEAEDTKNKAESVKKDADNAGNKKGNKRLKALLKKGLRVRLEKEETTEIEELFLKLLPERGAAGEVLEWEIGYSNDDPGEEDKSDLLSLSMKAKEGGERLMWFHVLYHREKNENRAGREKVGRFPAARQSGKHAFTHIGKTEVRAVADNIVYKNDAIIDHVILSFDVAAIEKL